MPSDNGQVLHGQLEPLDQLSTGNLRRIGRSLGQVGELVVKLLERDYRRATAWRRYVIRMSTRLFKAGSVVGQARGSQSLSAASLVGTRPKSCDCRREMQVRQWVVWKGNGRIP